MTTAFSSPLGVGEAERPTAAHWGLALAGAALLQVAVAWAALTFLPEPEAVVLETEEALAIKLGPPGGRIEDRKPPPPKPKPQTAAPVAPPPDVPLERAPDASDVTPSPPPPEGAVGGQVSSGFGAGGSGGAAPPPPPPPDPPFDRKLLDAYLARARLEFISRLNYPKELEQRGVEGRGAINVTVDRRGRVLGSEITLSTGNSELDAQIRLAAEDLKRLEPLPRGYPRDRLTFSVPVRFIVVEGKL